MRESAAAQEEEEKQRRRVAEINGAAACMMRTLHVSTFESRVSMITRHGVWIPW